MKNCFLALMAMCLFMICTFGSSEAALVSDPTGLSDSIIDIDFDTTFPDSINGVEISGGYGYEDSNRWTAATSYPDFISGNMLIISSTSQEIKTSIEFSTPVSGVGFGLFDSNFEGTGFEAFDILGNSLTGGFVQSSTGHPGGGFASYMGIQESSNIISKIVITAASGDYLALDNISINSVPVPSSILLLGFGLITLVGPMTRKL